MNISRARQRRLSALMRRHKINSTEVGAILDRTPSYVRQWRAGMKPMPQNMLRLLELELAVRKRTSLGAP